MINLESLKKLKLKKNIYEKVWNKSLVVPFLQEEIVFVHPNQKGVSDKYIKIIHSDEITVSIFSKSYFE